MDTKPKLILEEFCFRAFDKEKSKNYINYEKEKFLEKVNELVTSQKQLVEGYAPFCKHIFLPNFVSGLKPGYLPVNSETEKLIKTKYEARQQNELPVLVRFVPMESIDITKIPDAKFLDLILYSKEQIVKENIAMKFEESKIEKLKKTDFDYGIISIKPLNIDHEVPMPPITMMRNALGKEEGGSGVKLEREKYMKSIEFWENNVQII